MRVKVKHTPGPWIFEPAGEHEDCPLILGGKNGSQLICTMPDESSEDGHTEAIRDANARLIAAAPDLLEAALYFTREGFDPDKGFDLLKAAIIKATGKR